MVYCPKCSRLLEAEASKCPFCGYEEAPEGTQNTAGADMDEQMRNISNMIDQNTVNSPPPIPNPAQYPQGGPQMSAHSSQPSYQGAPNMGAPYGTSQVVLPDPELSGGAKAGLIILSLFIPIAGLIVGIVYMNKPYQNYKKFGLIMVIISAIVMVLWLLCCCFIGASASYMGNY